jgi:anaerobic selenocysteine-containing dehydrogenase
MINHWVDLQHCKTILVEGSNVAENHPMAFKWIRKAQENGAKIIHVDPRFTRTSATADMYARIRPGTDAALLNTVINYVIVHKLYDVDYITTHTNALFLGDAAFDFKDGLFSGFDEEKHKWRLKTLLAGCIQNPTFRNSGRCASAWIDSWSAYPAIARYSSVFNGTRARIVVPAPGCDFTESSPCTNCNLSRMLIKPRPWRV